MKIIVICDNCGWTTPQANGRTAWQEAFDNPGTPKRGLADCPRCRP